MEPNFDLDVNNYTADDLLSFFKLDNNYTLDDLNDKEQDIINEITKANSKYATKYKFDLINFIKQGKNNLLGIKQALENTSKINKGIKDEISSFANNEKDKLVGKIINPFYPHPAMEKNINPQNTIDGYNYNTTTSVYVFNTLGRNDFLSSTSSDCNFDLPIVWNNVIQVNLSLINIPNVMFAFSSDSGTNQIYIEEDGTGLSGIVTIPNGNYIPWLISPTSPLPITQASFSAVLQNSINTQLGSGSRFSVTFQPSDYSMTITNSTYTFSMNTIIKDPSELCNSYAVRFNNNFQNININNKSNITTSQYVQTMGYLMGYRSLYYSGSKSYTTESTFNNTYSDYLYFVFEDYTGSQTVSNTYGVLTGSTLSQGILGVIPISSGLFETTFDTNANFINKKREYFGPVNISRISIKILNQKGNVVNLRGNDFSFAFQVKTIYNLTQKSVGALRGVGIGSI